MAATTEVVVFVAIDAGSNRECTDIAPAAKTILAATVRRLNYEQTPGRCSVLAYCLADLPDWGMRWEDADRWKAAVLKPLLAKPITPITSLAKNSKDEAYGIRKALATNRICPSKIVLFCDRWHVRLGGLRMIWEEAFPGIKIEIEGVRCQFGADYACTYMRSEARWIVHNLVRYVSLKTGLLDRITAWRSR